jgi:hypothetical protein
VIRFKGTITATDSGPVSYTFTRSDGATGPPHTLAFTAAGSREVETT